MKKHSTAACLLKTAALVSLFVPYRFEKTEDGFTAASVIGKLTYRRTLTPTEAAEAPEGTQGVTTLSFPGLAEDQLDAAKRLLAEGKIVCRRKKAEMAARIAARRRFEQDAQRAAEETPEADAPADAAAPADTEL